MTTLMLVFSLLSAVCLSLPVPVEKPRNRKARDMSFEELYRSVYPVQSMAPYSFLIPVDQFVGMQLSPYRLPSVMRPYSPGFHPYPHPHPRPYPPVFPFRPSVAVQPPIIVLERVPSTPSATARPQATVIPVG